jgi:hypothetical protein
MPTPESEAFLAKKPKVPPTFEGVDFDDNVALKAAQDAILREQWVRSMMARLVRDEMNKCYRREGVNHMEECGYLRGRCSTPYCCERLHEQKFVECRNWEAFGYTWIRMYGRTG